MHTPTISCSPDTRWPPDTHAALQTVSEKLAVLISAWTSLESTAVLVVQLAAVSRRCLYLTTDLGVCVIC